VISSISLDFDPTASILGIQTRLETLAIAGAIFLVILLTAFAAGRARAIGPDGETELPRLRRDDLILVAFGAVPGAVVGGRIGYGLVHLDFYRNSPDALFDPAQGGLSLTLAVVLGAISAMTVARLLSAPIRRWAAAAALPLLVGLGLGKLAMILGGAGQGSYSDASYATSYVRQGPWESANASYPAIPSQAIEGLAVLALAAVVFVLPAVLRLRLRRWRFFVRPGVAPARDWALLSGGQRFLTVLALWGLARFAVVFTWRDAAVLGPLKAEHLVLIPILAVVILGPGVVTLVRSGLAGLRAWRSARRERRALALEAAKLAAEHAAIDAKIAGEKAAAEACADVPAAAAAAADAIGEADAIAAADAIGEAAADPDPCCDSGPDDGLTFDHKGEQSARANG
jgi:prolipoprotein diacylglyceryltransferase